MEELTGILAVTLIFGGATAVFLANSQIGRAVADRIRGDRDPTGVGARGDDEQLDQLIEEVETLRSELTDVQERLDFTERLLARGSEPPKSE
jgi:hypothetical protein